MPAATYTRAGTVMAVMRVSEGAGGGARVVNEAVAANCNVFRDAPQVQLRANFPAQVFPLPHFV